MSNLHIDFNEIASKMQLWVDGGVSTYDFIDLYLTNWRFVRDYIDSKQNESIRQKEVEIEKKMMHREISPEDFESQRYELLGIPAEYIDKFGCMDEVMSACSGFDDPDPRLRVSEAQLHKVVLLAIDVLKSTGQTKEN